MPFTHAFLLGYNSGKSRRSDTCPFPADSDSRKEWYNGYDEARFVKEISFGLRRRVEYDSATAPTGDDNMKQGDGQ